MKEKRYDVVIVGAGPAGSTLAFLLSKKKAYNIAVVDSRDWDSLWGKPCGNAIGKHHFGELGIPEPRGDEVRQVVNGISIYSPREDVVFKVYGEGYVIDRNKLGKRLMKDAVDNGVEFYTKSHAVKPLIEDGKVTGILAKINGETVEIKAKVTVDASGVTSVLKRGLPREWPVAEPLDPKDSEIAYREIVELGYEIEDPDFIRIYLNQNIAPGGYWWFFPEGKTRANIGLGVQGGMGHPSPMKIYKEKIMKRPELNGIKKTYSAMGAPVPTRRPLDSLAWDGILIIGDAGFTVNPIHGGGMGYSMISAYWASKAIENALEKDDVSKENLWLVNTGYMKMIGAKQASLEILRIFLQNLTDDDLQFVMEKKIVSEDDVDLIGRKGELKESTAEKASRLVGDILKVIRTSVRPSLLLKLKTLSAYMKRMSSIYLEYPETPEGLSEWQKKVNSILEDFKKEIGMNH